MATLDKENRNIIGESAESSFEKEADNLINRTSKKFHKAFSRMKIGNLVKAIPLLIAMATSVESKGQTDTSKLTNIVRIQRINGYTSPTFTARGDAYNQETFWHNMQVCQDADATHKDMQGIVYVMNAQPMPLNTTGNAISDINAFFSHLSNNNLLNDPRDQNWGAFATNLYQGGSKQGRDSLGFAVCVTGPTGSLTVTSAKEALKHDLNHGHGILGNPTFPLASPANHQTSIGGPSGTINGTITNLNTNSSWALTNGKSIGSGGGGTFTNFGSVSAVNNIANPINSNIPGGGSTINSFNTSYNGTPLRISCPFIELDPPSNGAPAGMDGVNDRIWKHMSSTMPGAGFRTEAVAPLVKPEAISIGGGKFIINNKTAYDTLKVSNTTHPAYKNIYYTKRIADVYVKHIDSLANGQYVYKMKLGDTLDIGQHTPDSNANYVFVVGTVIGNAASDTSAKFNRFPQPTTTNNPDIVSCNNPVTIGGTTYSGPGNYTHTDTAQYAGTNLDSNYAHTNVKIHPAVSTINNPTITNCGPLVYAGQTFNSSGTHTVTFQFANSTCDSLEVNTPIQINPNSAPTNLPAVHGYTPFTYQGSTYNVSGTHSDTLTNSAGCDSVINTPVFVYALPSNTNNPDIHSCNLSVTIGGTTYSGPGNYTHTDTAQYAGTNLDSNYAHTNVKIHPAVSTINNPTITNCGPLVYAGQTFNSSGTHTLTFQFNGSTCDSLEVNTPIQINPNSAPTNLPAVHGYTPFTYQGSTYNVSGTHSDTLTNSAGCDSVINTPVFVYALPSNTNNPDIHSCSLSVTIGGTTYSGPGNYTHTDTTQYAGTNLDSNYAHTNVKIHPAVSTINNPTITNCGPLTYLGQTFNSSGTHTVTFQFANSTCDSIEVNTPIQINQPSPVTYLNVGYVCNSGEMYNSHVGPVMVTNDTTINTTLQNAVGCDSVVLEDIKITIIDTTLSVSGRIVTSNEGGSVAYQWLKNSTPMIGETAQSLNVANTDSGDFSVQITKNACTDTSMKANLFPVSTYNITKEHGVIIYPNPVKNSLTVKSAKKLMSLKILNMVGQQVAEHVPTSRNENQINISNLPGGIYLIKAIAINGTVYHIEIVKQ